jgi:hypothetical protein
MTLGTIRFAKEAFGGDFRTKGARLICKDASLGIVEQTVKKG